MNERIIKLGLDSHMLNYIDNETPRRYFLSGHADEDDLKKFAELIVRECLGCCEHVISDPVPESVDTWLNGGSQCIQEIKEHFGLGMSVADKKQLIKDLLGVQK